MKTISSERYWKDLCFECLPVPPLRERCRVTIENLAGSTDHVMEKTPACLSFAPPMSTVGVCHRSRNSAVIETRRYLAIAKKCCRQMLSTTAFISLDSCWYCLQKMSFTHRTADMPPPGLASTKSQLLSQVRSDQYPRAPVAIPIP